MSSVSKVFVCLVVLCGSFAFAADPDLSLAPFPVHAAQGAVEAVPKWDTASPQELFRIDGRLYQRDAGMYYKVIDDHVTVRLADGVSSWAELVETATAADPVHAALADLTQVRRNRLNIVDLQIPSGEPDEWAAMIHSTGLARYAEIATYGSYTVVPNDSSYGQQWALNNTGQTGGTAGADIGAEEAWEIASGDPSAIVGILDSGTLFTHPDLAGNMWNNEDEIPGNNIDDDNNGFIDDTVGWDFPNNNNNPSSNSFHGTHVAGIVLAVTDNGLGIAGVAGGMDGNPGAQGMIVEVGSSFPVGSIMDEAVLYAMDNGARGITMSLTVGASSALDDALDEAYLVGDVFINNASGNNGSSVGYPATHPHVMAVASSTHNDAKSGFSNPGPQVEVTAPGSDILSTQLSNGYGLSSGTSFASPHVAGLAALIRGHNPSLTAPEVRQLIIDTADDISSPGFDNGTGWGRINAHEALLAAGSSDGSVELDATVYTCGGTLNIEVLDFDLAGLGSFSVTVTSGTEGSGETVIVTESGTGIFTGSITLAAGPAAPDGILQVNHGDLIVAEYIDADDGAGGVDVPKTDAATADCAGPSISGIGVLNVDDKSARIEWTTDEPATSAVIYGSTVPPGQQVFSATLETAHLELLSGLDSCTNYFFEVRSADALGNLTSDDQLGSYYSFQTLGNFPGIGIGPCQEGQAQLDRLVYGCSGTATVSVIDVDLNVDFEANDQVTVLMTSSTEPDGEWITLTESGPSSATFNGTIALTAGPVEADGLLSMSAGDLVSATYYDVDNGQGESHIATATSTADCIAPGIQNLSVTAVSSTRAVIEWNTSEPATSRVEFGATAALGSAVEDATLKTSHSLAISAFEACDRAHFRVLSADEFGDVRIADAAGQPFELNLNEIGGLLFHDNFEVEDGWSLSGEWQRGEPLSQGGGSGDPQSAYSGTNVLGLDLDGDGDYEPNSIGIAESPLIDASGVTDVELILRRKLGVASGDSAKITFKKLFTQSVWSSTGAVDDPDWIEQRVPLAAADNGTFQIGFTVTSNASGQSYGWNVDEVVVKDSKQPDYLACGTCSGAPTFAGATAAYDAEPCGASGVTVEWQPAPAWGTGANGTYDVYRGTTDDFPPDAGNRVASAVSGTSWIDNGVPADTPVWYVVRARNDEDCGGEGLDDGNLVRLAATETSAQTIPDALGASVMGTNVGGAHVRLSWAPAPGATHYVVRRSISSSFAFPIDVGTTELTHFEDVDAAPDGVNYFYKVVPQNACGEEAN